MSCDECVMNLFVERGPQVTRRHPFNSSFSSLQREIGGRLNRMKVCVFMFAAEGDGERWLSVCMCIRIPFTVSAATSLLADHLLRLDFGCQPTFQLHHGVSSVKGLLTRTTLRHGNYQNQLVLLRLCRLAFCNHLIPGQGQKVFILEFLTALSVVYCSSLCLYHSSCALSTVLSQTVPALPSPLIYPLLSIC